jgi:hypothetical protein
MDEKIIKEEIWIWSNFSMKFSRTLLSTEQNFPHGKSCGT